MGHRMNNLSLDDNQQSSEDHSDQINHADSHLNHRRMNFRNDQRNQLHFTNLKTNRISTDFDKSRTSHQNSQRSETAHRNNSFDLDDVLNDLDFKSDLQLRPRSSNDNGIVDDHILHKYKKILHHYNNKYGLKTASSSSKIFSLGTGGDLSSSSEDSVHSSSPVLPLSKNFNHAENHYNDTDRTGIRKYNGKDSYYRRFRWVKWGVATVIVFMIGSGELFYRLVHNRVNTATSYSMRQMNKHHHDAITDPVKHSLNIKQKKQIMFLVDELYGRVNRLINSSDYDDVTQVKFTSVPLSNLFINGTNNRSFQNLANRCILIRNQHNERQSGIKNISPDIKAIHSNGHLVQIDIDSKIQILVNHRNRKIRINSNKNLKVKIAKHNGRYQFVDGDVSSLV